MRLLSRLGLAGIALLAVHCSASEQKPIDEPEIIENRPGTLVISAPSRAAFIESEGSSGTKRITIKGTGATHALTINGEHVDVAPDGSFESNVAPSVGLNLVVAVDGEARLETPFLYGHFAPANEPVKKAIAIEVGAEGIEAPLPDASLTSVTNVALEGRDLIAMLRGQSFSGEGWGATWSFKVTGGSHERPDVALHSGNRGVGVVLSAKNLFVDGDLKIVFGGIEYEHPVRISAARASILGEALIAVAPDTGVLGVEMPAADAWLDGFQYSSDNSGFPCCVDGIVTGFLHPKVEEGIRDGVRNQLPNALKLTLEGAGLPNEIDLTSTTGIPLRVGIKTALDSGTFDERGGLLTASALFDGHFSAESPGAKAPGWLTFGRSFDTNRVKRASSFGASIAVDAINQAFFAAWGSGTLAYTAPDPLKAKLTPALPPIVAITESGALRLGLGEVQVQRADSSIPFAGATVLQDVTAKMEGDVLVLEPQGEPTISVTYLTEGNIGSGLNLVALAAKEQLQKFLKPFRIPVPKIALNGLGGGFVGQSLGVKSANIVLDRQSGRIGVAGAMTLAK
jgi:hypothetical protein